MIRSARAVQPELPTRTGLKDAKRWWKRFLNGESPAEIGASESPQRDQLTIEKGLEYMAFRIGAPSPSTERIRIIEAHHRSLVDLNQQIENSKAVIETLDRDIDAFRQFHGSLIYTDKDTAGLLGKFLDLRRFEVAALNKLYIELRGVSMALSEMFQLKKLPMKDPSQQKADELGMLDRLSAEELQKLIQSQIDSADDSIPDADEYYEEDEEEAY